LARLFDDSGKRHHQYLVCYRPAFPGAHILSARSLFGRISPYFPVSELFSRELHSEPGFGILYGLKENLKGQAASKSKISPEKN